MEPIIIDLSQPMSKEKISQLITQAYKDGYNAGKRSTFLYGGPYITPTPAIKLIKM